MKSWLAQVHKGLVELCVMSVLREQEAYGYQLLQRLQSSPGLAISESTVYPILARLTREGLLTVRDAPSPAGPTRRYYSLTRSGGARLSEMAAAWAEIESSVGDLVNGSSSPATRELKKEN